MSLSAVAHAAIFTAGALVGAGITATLTRPKRDSTVARPLKSEQSPIVDVSTTGKPGVIKLRSVPPSDILKYGNPGPISDLLTRKVYVAAYDRRLRHPSWTAEHLTQASISKPGGGDGDEGGDRNKSRFQEDETLPAEFRATLQNYFRSGYDRGHMVPAADAKVSQDAMDETFLLSNIAPQVGAGFNRHCTSACALLMERDQIISEDWAYVEEWCRRLTTSFSDVYVFTVPLYLPKRDTDGKWRVTHEVIGSPPNISVPTHFAKVVLTTRATTPSSPSEMEVSTGAFVLPNAAIADDTPFEQFSVPVDAVEKAAGITIFSDEIKRQSLHICQTASCTVFVRRFDDAVKNLKATEA